MSDADRDGRKAGSHIPATPRSADTDARQSVASMQAPHQTASALAVGANIATSLAVLGRNIVPFGVLAIVFSAPVPLYTILLDTRPSDAQLAIIEGTAPVMGVVHLLLAVVLFGMLTYGTFQDLRGRRAGIGVCIGGGFSTMLPVLGVAIVVAVGFALGWVLFVVPGLIILTMLWVAVPAAVVERPGVMAALKRSVTLTSGNRWRIFAMILILFVLEGVVGAVIDEVFSSFGEPTTPSIYATWALDALTNAFTAVLATVTYFELRNLHDGINVDDIAAVFD